MSLTLRAVLGSIAASAALTRVQRFAVEQAIAHLDELVLESVIREARRAPSARAESGASVAETSLPPQMDPIEAPGTTRWLTARDEEEL